MRVRVRFVRFVWFSFEHKKTARRAVRFRSGANLAFGELSRAKGTRVSIGLA